jgi:hypothetical protein
MTSHKKQNKTVHLIEEATLERAAVSITQLLRSLETGKEARFDMYLDALKWDLRALPARSLNADALKDLDLLLRLNPQISEQNLEESLRDVKHFVDTGQMPESVFGEGFSAASVKGFFRILFALLHEADEQA